MSEESKPSMNIWEKRAFLLASMVLIYFIAIKFADNLSNNDKSNFVQTKIDTVDHIKPIQAVHNNYPKTIIIQEKADTVYRDRVENETIITGVEVKGNEVIVDKVDTAGVRTKEIHKIDEGSKVKIDSKGFEERKRTKMGKLLRKTAKVGKRALEVVGVISIIYIAVK